jgi:hypothetical protein
MVGEEDSHILMSNHTYGETGGQRGSSMMICHSSGVGKLAPGQYYLSRLK